MKSRTAHVMHDMITFRDGLTMVKRLPTTSGDLGQFRSAATAADHLPQASESVTVFEFEEVSDMVQVVPVISATLF